MAISTNGNGFGNNRRRGSTGTLSEINVTPFVDVVLVLLIIFMLTAHIMDFGLEVDVPKVRMTKESAQDLPVVTIRKTGDIYLNEQMVNINDLKTEVSRRFGSGKAIYVKADRETIYEPIAQVVAELGADGFQVRLVTQPEDAATAKKGRR
jgi:biopolymer transport protein ExbD